MLDDRREIVIADDFVPFAVNHWIQTAQKSIAKNQRFAVALSGGSTPAAIYKELAHHAKSLPWSKVFLFWSDERTVPPHSSDSNYRMAMEHFSHLPLIPSQIFRMKGEEEIQSAANEYEKTIRSVLGPSLFDLVMLGVGADGHTASLFPHTAALNESERLVVANHVPPLNAWRLTLTLPCINQSARAVIYAAGATKQTIVTQVLHAPAHSPWPASAIGTSDRKALWILDQDAAQLL